MYSVATTRTYFWNLSVRGWGQERKHPLAAQPAHVPVRVGVLVPMVDHVGRGPSGCVGRAPTRLVLLLAERDVVRSRITCSNPAVQFGMLCAVGHGVLGCYDPMPSVGLVALVAWVVARSQPPKTRDGDRKLQISAPFHPHVLNKVHQVAFVVLCAAVQYIGMVLRVRARGQYCIRISRISMTFRRRRRRK